MLHSKEKIDPQSAILGLWDGHDAGAALVAEGRLLFAVNEERFSRRKLEIGFPTQSISAALQFAEISPEDILHVAVSTSDFAKTLTRCIPSLREEYYQLRRRKKTPRSSNRLKKTAKYKLTELGSSQLTAAVSSHILYKELHRQGLVNAKLSIVDHHLAHAAGAVYCSGYPEAVVLTLDGLGDGLSGTIWNYRESSLQAVAKLSAKASLGIFFEHVTNLLNMRELEDEGKVMALANFAYPIADSSNPLLNFFTVDGLALRARYSSTTMHRELAKVLWSVPSEQFAYMAQRTLEVKVLELLDNVLSQTGRSYVVYSGGLASNIKVNMLIREHPSVRGLYVFPHMGDGGLAAGAAISESVRQGTWKNTALNNAFLGPEYSDEEIGEALKSCHGCRIERPDDIALKAARLIAIGEVLMWFQNRMEFGPRALGARSILALPNSLKVKNALNMKLKRRVWYQPFCPSILEEDAFEILEDYAGPANTLMTCGYRVKKEKQGLVQGVINVDGTCRPQIIPNLESSLFSRFLKEVKRLTGHGMVLNTSFNLHGDAMVMSPEDAIETFLKTDVNCLLIGGFLVTKNGDDQ